MGACPVENLSHLRPVGHILKLQRLDRSTRDNHAVILLALHLLEVAIEHHHVLYRRVLGRMTLQLHEVDFQLQRRIGQQADKVCLRRYLQRHQVEYRNAQGTDVLHVSTRIVHYKYVLLLQKFYGRKFIWQS